jgi:branched-chain amino acid transport system permease protein
MRLRWPSPVPRRATAALAALFAVLAVAPIVANNYQLSVLTLVLYYAYVGQAWNIMFGFAGLLSLGHALFIGIGSYASAALFVHFGIGPWAGVFLAVALAVAVGCFIALLGFRFAISGVYFALLTIAFAEFTRIVCDHIGWLGATEGLFLPVSSRSRIDLANLRGPPEMFYYLMLTLTFAALGVSRWLLHSKLGYCWRAIRDDPEAAAATGVNVFWCRMAAVAISCAASGIAGVWYAFYYNNLFPEIAFDIGKSIEITFAPIVGGVGTLFGPVLGAFLLFPLGELITGATQRLGLEGIKQFIWGIAVVAIVLLRPSGVWPWLWGILGLAETGEEVRP